MVSTRHRSRPLGMIGSGGWSHLPREVSFNPAVAGCEVGDSFLFQGLEETLAGTSTGEQKRKTQDNPVNKCPLRKQLAGGARLVVRHGPFPYSTQWQAVPHLQIPPRFPEPIHA